MDGPREGAVDGTSGGTVGVLKRQRGRKEEKNEQKQKVTVELRREVDRLRKAQDEEKMKINGGGVYSEDVCTSFRDDL